MRTGDVRRSCRRGAGPLRVDRLGIVDYLAAWDTQRAHATAAATAPAPTS